MASDLQRLKDAAQHFDLRAEEARRELDDTMGQATDLERILESLMTSHTQDANQPFGPFAATGADLVWHGWVETRRTQILQELAVLRARALGQKEKLRLAHGKAASFAAVLDARQEKRRKALDEAEKKRIQEMQLCQRLN